MPYENFWFKFFSDLFIILIIFTDQNLHKLKFFIQKNFSIIQPIKSVPFFVFFFGIVNEDCHSFYLGKKKSLDRE